MTDWLMERLPLLKITENPLSRLDKEMHFADVFDSIEPGVGPGVRSQHKPFPRHMRPPTICHFLSYGKANG